MRKWIIAIALFTMIALGILFFQITKDTVFLGEREPGLDNETPYRFTYQSTVKWLPNGEGVSYIGIYSPSNRADIYIKDLNFKKEKIVAASLGGGYAFSPDANRVVYFVNSNDERRFKIFDRTTKETVSLNLDLGYGTEILQWSPDGKKLLFEKDGKDYFKEVYVINPDGTNLAVIFNNSILPHDKPPFDDQYIQFTARWFTDPENVYIYVKNETYGGFIYIPFARINLKTLKLERIDSFDTSRHLCGEPADSDWLDMSSKLASISPDGLHYLEYKEPFSIEIDSRPFFFVLKESSKKLCNPV